MTFQELKKEYFVGVCMARASISKVAELFVFLIAPISRTMTEFYIQKKLQATIKIQDRLKNLLTGNDMY